MTDLISIECIDDNPFQSRQSYDEAAILELATDIAERGLLQPVVARPEPGGRCQLAFGHRRLRAFRLLHEQGAQGYNAIPCEVRTISTEQMALYAWSENAQRKDLTPIEEAQAIRTMLDRLTGPRSKSPPNSAWTVRPWPTSCACSSFRGSAAEGSRNALSSSARPWPSTHLCLAPTGAGRGRAQQCFSGSK
jgi:hypothetical protein